MIVRRLIQLALLVGVYVVVVGSAEPGDLAVGSTLAVILLVLYGRRLWGDASRAEGSALKRAAAFLPFVVAVGARMIKGTFEVASVVLGLRETTPGMVKIPVGDRSAVGAAVTSLAVTLSPGTLLIDSDLEQGFMLFHIIDAADPDAFRADQQHVYDNYQKKVFP